MIFPIKSPKKLIEVALPLDLINIACAREKSIRHGHPSTLHLWWARRPLAAARAVIFSQMVNDPSWKWELEHQGDIPPNNLKASWAANRKRLFKIIEDLVLWENSTNVAVLERAHNEIKKSWRETCELNNSHPLAVELFNPDKLPALHDPFAGGGAIPLEGQRLGLEAYASDLNPVAVLINKSMIEIPPKFAGRAPVNPEARKDTSLFKGEWKHTQGLAADVRYYGKWMRDEAEKRIGHLYPQVIITAEMAKERADLKQYVGRKLTVIAWLWARTVKSPSPAFAQVDVPLAGTFMLSTKAGKEAYVEPIIEDYRYSFNVKVGKPENVEAAKNGTKLARASFTCLLSGSPISGDYLKSEGKAGRLGARLMAIVVEGDKGRIYLPPSSEHEDIIKQAIPTWKPELTISGSTQYLGVKPYGMDRFDQLFTDRQLVALSTFSDLVEITRDKVKQDALATGMHDDGNGLAVGGIGATAYAETVGMYLAFAVDKGANYWSSVCAWHTGAEKMVSTFGRQAIPMIWDFTDANPFSDSSGNVMLGIEQASKMINTLGIGISGNASQSDAARQIISKNKVVSTDPPYYDNVPYADLSDFFYVWLRRSQRNTFPDLFSTIAVPKADELVAFAYRHENGKLGAEAFFLDGMTQAMHRIAEQAHPSFPVTIYYAFRQAETDDLTGTVSTGWDTFLAAIIKAGFAISGTWPMRTEYTSTSFCK